MRLAFSAAFLLILVPLAALIAICAWWLWPHTGYLSELTLSGAAYSDQNKLRDVFLIPGFMGACVIAAAMLWTVLKFQFKAVPALPDKQARLVTVGRSATIVLLLVLAASGAIGWEILAGSGLCFLVAQIRLQDEWDRGGATLVLFACAIAVLLENTLHLNPAVVLPVALFSASILLWFLPQPANLIRWIFRGSAVLVAAAITLASPVFWQPVNERNASITLVDLPFFLVGALILKAALFDGRVLASKRELLPEAGLTLALAAAFTMLQTQEFSLPVVPEDDYHFGEYLISSDWFSRGLLFSEGFPAHGLFDAMGGIIARQRGEDSATAILLGFGVFAFFCKFAILLSVLKLFRVPLGLMGFVLLLPIVEPTRLGEIAIIAILAAVGMRAPPVIAGIVTVLISAMGVFTFGGAGVVLAVTGFCLAAIGQYRRSEHGFRNYAITAFAIGLLLVAIAHQAVLGWLWYLLESTRTNILLYGLGLETWLSGSPNWIDFAFAHAFAAVPFVGIALLVMFNPKLSTTWRQFAALFAAVLPLMISALLWNSYAMGRIDPGYARAAIVTVTMGATFACWAAVLAPPAARGVALGLAALLIVPVGSGDYKFHTPLAPNNIPLPSSPQNGAADRFRIGEGAFAQFSLDRLEKIDAVLQDAGLQPKEALGNLTNRSAINYYLDRPLAMVLTSAYNAGSNEFQAASLKSWHAAAPRIFLISADNMEHDGYKLSARAFEFYRFIVEEDYSPLVVDGMVFAVHNSIMNGSIAPQKLAFELLDVTDTNWTQGIANQTNTDWSIAVEEGARGLLLVGDQLQVSDGSVRSVLRVDGLNVKLDDREFAGSHGRDLMFTVLNREVVFDPETVVTSAFRLENLNRWPSALGRSMPLLREHSIDDTTPILLSLTRTEGVEELPEDGGPAVLAAKSGAVFVFRAEETFVPGSNGLFDIELHCVAGTGAPSWRVSWNRPAEPTNPMASITFVSSYFRNLVALDTNANWLLSEAVGEIRLELLDMGGCASVSVSAARLISRRPLNLEP